MTLSLATAAGAALDEFLRRYQLAARGDGESDEEVRARVDCPHQVLRCRWPCPPPVPFDVTGGGFILQPCPGPAPDPPPDPAPVERLPLVPRGDGSTWVPLTLEQSEAGPPE